MRPMVQDAGCKSKFNKQSCDIQVSSRGAALRQHNDYC